MRAPVLVPELRHDLTDVRVREIYTRLPETARRLLTAGWSPEIAAELKLRDRSPSGADAAAVAGLVAAGATDEELLEIWTTSALARPKLDRADYVSRTLMFARASVVQPSIIEIKSVSSVVWFDGRATFNAVVVAGTFSGETFRPAISIRSAAWAHAFASAGLAPGEDIDAVKQLVGRQVRLHLRRSSHWLECARWLAPDPSAFHRWGVWPSMK